MTTNLSSTPPMTGSSGNAVEAPAASPGLPADHLALPEHLLDGGEVIILAIKPSLWSVVFTSFQWLVCGLAAIAVGRAEATPGWLSDTGVIQAVLAVVALRVGFAALQWGSRVYVLTNRRVMRIRGVFRADVFECPLVKALNTGVHIGPHEALTRLGTIWFNTGAPSAGDGSWYHVGRPHEIHAEIRRAIEKAIDRQPHP